MDGRRTGAWNLAAGLLLSALAGFAAGVLGTFKHQVGISAATGAGLPIGLVLSVLMVALLLVALRVSLAARRYALAAAAGVVLAIGVLSMPGPGGSRVILLNAAGIAWLVAPAVVGLVVVLWPRAGQAPGGILAGDPPEEGRTPQ